MKGHRLLWALVVAAAALAVLHAQDTATFRATTDLVSIYATVTDRTGRLVTDLTRDDFRVTDNGRRQTLSTFSNDLQPFSAVVMIDRSGSMARHFDLVREAAGTFVHQLLPGDRLRIGNFSRDIVLSPANFTSDRDTLLEILQEELQEMGGSSPVWAAIDRSITALQSEPGRRVVLVFSDGKDESAGSDQPRTALDNLIRRARENDVMVYAVGFGYTETLRVPTLRQPNPGRRPPRPRPPMPGPPPLPVPVPRPPSRDTAQPQWWPGTTMATKTESKPPHPGLKKLAGESGGGYFEMSAAADLDAIFARVAEELHRQYWLGFAPTKRDGKTHQLGVSVRRSGLTVRARKDYVATAR